MSPVKRFAVPMLCAWLLGCDSSQPSAKPEEPVLPPTPEEHLVGKETYDNGCGSCHDSSREGSPRLGYLVAWKRRLAQGEETLVQHAIEGLDLMPPRGDNPDLTDEQVASAVRYMIYRANLDIPAKH